MQSSPIVLVGDNPSYLVDTTPPTVSSVVLSGATNPLNNRLNAGDVLTATVATSEAVLVNGVPQLALKIGSTTVYADYDASSSTSTSLKFNYTILSGQTDANGVSIDANSIGLNGGTITDLAGNNAVLTHSSVGDNASYLVDTTPPTVSSVVLSGATNPLNNRLNAGDVLTATVATSEAVLVNGVPQLALKIGSTTVYADYDASSSTSTSLKFNYTILSGQTDANGVSIDANSIGLNGGTITDLAGNDAVLTHSSVGDNSSYLVDTTPPTVSSVVLSGATNALNNRLNAGDVLTATVATSEGVLVNGVPQLALKIGSTTVYADYDASSSTSTSLKFNIVQSFLVRRTRMA
jgi:DNA-binding MltR family transcriptional regulator